jgi:broad specificity phosphatase PhoE
MGSPLGPDAQVWLIRHGETEWSRGGRHTGRTDIGLTERGRAQAGALRPVLAALRPALVLVSPRVRAQTTAELAGLTIDAVDPDLAEWDYGDYEGLTTPEIRERDPGWTIWTGKVPGGESAEQVAARADRVLARARTQLTRDPGRPVVLVAHGHMNRMLGARWIDLAPTEGGVFALGTATTSVLGFEHGSPVIAHWNVTPPEPLTPDLP